MRYGWVFGALCALGTLAGCVRPTLIGDYAVRPATVEYGGIQGDEVFVGRCDRAEDTGDLTNCRRLQIRFED